MTRSGGPIRVGRKSRKQVNMVTPAKKQKTYTKGQVTVRRALKNTIPTGTFSRIGGNLGGIFGPAGAAFGRGAGSVLSSITGMGDYKVKSNSILTDTASFSGEVPTFGKTDNSTRVRHREFVMDVTVSSTPAAFTNTTYVIQPSNATLFPWLSSLAQNYQQYKLHGMVMVFKSTTSDYSAAGALGKVAMATNYNVRDSAFVNMQELENAEFSVSGKPSLSRVHPIECAPNNGVPLIKWVRDTDYDASGGDDRLYDVGKFQFATSGLPSGTANAVIGELWISYDIEFFKPIVNRQTPAQTLYQPVSLPVFDINAGGPTASTATQSMFMYEEANIFKPTAGWASKADLVEKMRNPGYYQRTDLSDAKGTRLSRSVYREDQFGVSQPDPATDPNGSYPCYWSNPDELVLQRKGVYHFRQRVKATQGVSGARESAAIASWTATQGSVSASSATAAQRLLMGRITVDGTLDALGEPVYVVMHSHVPSSAYVLGQPPNDVELTTTNKKQTVYITGMEWDLVVWVRADHPQGGGVKIRFRDCVSQITDYSTNIGLQIGTVDYVNTDNIDRLTCSIAFVSASMATYYEPVVQGLTTDDKQQLKDSISTVEALLPKLRELGFV